MLAEEGDDISAIEAPSGKAEAAKPEPKEEKKAEATSSSSEAPASPPKQESSRTSDSAASGSKPAASHKHPKHSRTLLPSVLRQLALNGIEDASVIKATGYKGQLSKGDVLAFLGKISIPTGTLPTEESHDKPVEKKARQSQSFSLCTARDC